MANIRFLPLNRHVTIEPHSEKNETTSGVLLPEDFAPELDKYIIARVLHVAEDCKDSLKEACWPIASREVNIVVDRSMIEEISVSGETQHLILVNYILGVVDPSPSHHGEV